MGVTVGAAIRVVTVVGCLSSLVSESEWLGRPVSLSNLSLRSECAISLVVGAVFIVAIISAIRVVRLSDNLDSSVGVSLEANEVII